MSNWTVSGKDWNTTTSSDPVSGSHLLTDSPDRDYEDGVIASITLVSSVDLAGSTEPVLTFWQKVTLSSYNPFTVGRDIAYVDASSDGGITWSQLGAYTSDANSTTWVQEALDLTAYAGQRVRVRFRLWDNAQGAEQVADGWHIDDVEVRELF